MWFDGPKRTLEDVHGASRDPGGAGGDVTGRDSDEVLTVCRDAGIPIVHGRVDRTLFEAVMRERSTVVREETHTTGR